MDRSFLADKDVIAASRHFVCIRLATYEDAEENKLLTSIFSRGGVLENTVFTILSPDGQETLVTPGRSPVWAFGGVNGPGINAQPSESIKKMADTMEAIALAYPGNPQATSDQAGLPYLADLRLALNVSAADRTPLTAVFSTDPSQLTQMTQNLADVAWSESIIGKSQYVLSKNPADFKSIKHFNADSGFIIIQPGTFGLTGEVITVIDAATNPRDLAKALPQALAKHKPSELTYDEHRREGARVGARWQSKTPNQEQSSGRRGGGRRGR